MASENDPTTPEQAEEREQAPVEKPKRRRATKKAAAPSETGAAPLEPGTPSTAVAIEFEADAGLAPADAGAAGALAPKKSPGRKAAKKSTRSKKAMAEAVEVTEATDAADAAAATDGSDEAAVAAPTSRARGPRKATKKRGAVDAATDAEAPDQPIEAVQARGATVAPEPEADQEPEEEEAVAPAVPSFGLLFQAPEPVAPRRRRATAPAQAPSERPAVEEPTESTPDRRGTGRRAEGPSDQAAAEPGEAATADETTRDEAGRPADDRSTDEGEGGSRRRRRGGRGRRGRGTSDDEAGGTASDSDAGGGDDTRGGGPDEQGDEGESATSRRRRRRRRGASGDGESEDPPGTVTRVREPRTQRDEPTAVKGSTRLEAKKQRRREGREAGRRRTIITEAEFLARRESVERVMVVRGRGDRTQIGVLEDGVLVEHYVSRETTASMAGNVYLGRVQNVLPSMEAAFVDIGKGRNAVLYAGEVNWDAAGLEGGQSRRIENALSSGDTVLVQVTKDPIGHKGARLTSQVSLPGRYLVYVPEGQMTGISRKLPDTERARLKAILKEVVPDSAGVIVRTAAEGASEEELRADVDRLTKIWDTIRAKADSAGTKKAGSGGAPALLHGEPDLTVRVIRDVFTEDFTSLVVSGDKAWSEVSRYVEDVAPDLAPRLVRWTAEEDVFSAHRIDESLAKAMDRKVWLPSGGSLVIDRTEAMTVVDVNTGKFIGSGGNLEETVTKNNLEAAEEIVRQLRLRDIGGIIVIDFIDMVLESNRDLVVRRLLECLGRDRTKHQVAEVTSLGLVQMTRKRVGSGLVEVFSEPCEHCGGRGIVVHSEPIDRGGSTESASHGGARSGRGRRGTATGPEHGSAAEEPRTPSGPTAAQIAAAAHAAAMRRAEADAGVDVPAVGATEPRAEEPVGEQPVPLDGEPAASVDTEEPVVLAEPEAVQPVVLGREAVEAPVVDTMAVEAPVVQEAPVVEPVAPQPRGRRKRGRVVAPAGPPRPLAAEEPGEVTPD